MYGFLFTFEGHGGSTVLLAQFDHILTLELVCLDCGHSLKHLLFGVHVIRVLPSTPKSMVLALASALSAPVRRLHPVLPYTRFLFVSKPMNGTLSLFEASKALLLISVMFHSPAKA